MATRALQLAGEQRVLGRLALRVVVLPRVRGDVMAALAQEGRGLVRRRHGQGVDDARARQLAEVLVQPGQPLAGGGQADDGQVQAAAVQRAAQHQRVRRGARAELVGDVAGDPGVRGRRGREDGNAGRQFVQQGAQPPVVGPEVVAPVRDAVRLVHHQHPGRGRQLGQHQVAEAWVVQPFRADQQHVHVARFHFGVDLLPLLGVGGVHRAGADARPACRLDLVAHEGEQRRDDDRRARRRGRAAARPR